MDLSAFKHGRPYKAVKFIIQNLTPMTTKLNLFWATIALLLLSGCASGYKAIRPKTINYTANNLDQGIGFSYRYDVLSEAGNKKYAKHEKSKNLKLVAVKVSNYTGHPLNLANDVIFTAGNKILVPADPLVVKNELKQNAPIYLLFLLLTPLNLNIYNSSSNGYGTEVNNSHSYPIGLLIGPGISIGNMVVASTANTNFYNELLSFTISRDIENGQTIYCLIGFRDIGYEPLNLKLKQ